MPYIELPEGLPGSLGLMAFRPEAARYLNELVEVLLRGPSRLTQGERELIATYVSAQSGCRYCENLHGAVAAHYMAGNEKLIDDVKQNFSAAIISDKLKALLTIAGKICQGGKCVSAEDFEQARQSGANDLEMHDTVLIAAVFTMFSRYVDGLATESPDDMRIYREQGRRIAEEGYEHLEEEALHRQLSFAGA